MSTNLKNNPNDTHHEEMAEVIARARAQAKARRILKAKELASRLKPQFDGTDLVVRFSLKERVQHFVLIFSFTALGFTGLMQDRRLGMMLRDMVRKPLEQTLVLLWLIGVSHIFTRFVSYEFSYTWVISSVLASFLCVYFVVRYPIPQLIPLPVLLGLAAFLVLL